MFTRTEPSGQSCSILNCLKKMVKCLQAKPLDQFKNPSALFFRPLHCFLCFTRYSGWQGWFIWHNPAFKESLPEESISMYQVHGDTVLQVSEKLKPTCCQQYGHYEGHDISNLFFIHRSLFKAPCLTSSLNTGPIITSSCWNKVIHSFISK